MSIVPPKGAHGLTTEPVGEFAMESSCVVGRTLVSQHQHQKIKQMFLKVEQSCRDCVRVATVSPNGEALGRSTAHTRWDLGADPD